MFLKGPAKIVAWFQDPAKIVAWFHDPAKIVAWFQDPAMIVAWFQACKETFFGCAKYQWFSGTLKRFLMIICRSILAFAELFSELPDFDDDSDCS